MTEDIENGTPMKGLMICTIKPFPKCFGSSNNVNIANCMSCWNKSDVMLFHKDIHRISHPISTNRRLQNTNSNDTC